MNSSTRISSNRGSARSEPFVFELKESRNVSIALNSDANTYLYLMQSCSTSGSVLEFDNDGGDGRNSQIARSLAAGVYKIDATTFIPFEIDADFNLTLSVQ